MKVALSAYQWHGDDPSRVEAALERGSRKNMLTLTVPGATIELDGLDLWRAVTALMADPQAHGLKNELLMGLQRGTTDVLSIE